MLAPAVEGKAWREYRFFRALWQEKSGIFPDKKDRLVPKGKGGRRDTHGGRFAHPAAEADLDGYAVHKVEHFFGILTVDFRLILVAKSNAVFFCNTAHLVKS